MRRIALILAANPYADPNINPLLGAEADALKLQELLSRHAGFETVPLIGFDQCSKSAVRKAMEGIRARLKPGDVFVLGALLHAVLLKGMHFLVCPQANLHELHHGHTDDAIALDWIVSRTEIQGLNRVLLLDVCRQHLAAAHRQSGPPVGVEEVSARNLVAATGGGGEMAVDEEFALTVLNACRKGAAAQEIVALKRGLFSVAFEEVFLERVSTGRGVRLDSDFKVEVDRAMRSLASRHGLPGTQQADHSCVGGVPVLVERIQRTETPGEAAAPSPVQVPATIPMPPPAPWWRRLGGSGAGIG